MLGSGGDVWARRSIDEGQRLGWRVGPLGLTVRRLGPGVVVRWERGDDDDVRVGVDDEVGVLKHRVRLVCPKPAMDVTLAPSLADRNVVFRSESPITIGPRGAVRVYVSSPLWVCVDAGGASYELPSRRPSDTWFGTPLAGELCYASKTSLRASLDVVGVRAHRAVTPLVMSASYRALVVERLQLPIPELGLWRAADGSMWTDTVTLEPQSDAELALVRVESAPPLEQPEAVQVRPPRRPRAPLSPLRVFNAFF